MSLAADVVSGFLAAIVIAHGAWWTILSLVAIPRPKIGAARSSGLRITVLVPAHNEEMLIAACIDSLVLAASDPKAEVLVVADNCDDRTADLATEHGASVIERTDATERGKGYALEFAIDVLRRRAEPPQVVAFVDADSQVTTNFFQVLTQAFTDGAEAVQVHYKPAASQSPLGALRGLALSLVHWSRPLGSSRLHLGTTLKGNGMAMTWTCASVGLGSRGITEDAAMTLSLARRGIRIRFAPAATVEGFFPDGYAAARTQDERWEGGRLELWPKAVATAFGCIRRGSLSCFVAACEVASLPLSILVLACLLLAALAALGIGSPAVAAAAGATIASYLVFGWTAARVQPSALFALLYAPKFLLYKLSVYCRLALGGPKNQWKRTDRT